MLTVYTARRGYVGADEFDITRGAGVGDGNATVAMGGSVVVVVGSATSAGLAYEEFRELLALEARVDELRRLREAFADAAVPEPSPVPRPEHQRLRVRPPRGGRGTDRRLSWLVEGRR